MRIIATACLVGGLLAGTFTMTSCQGLGFTYKNETAQQSTISLTYPDGGVFTITLPADLDTETLIALQTHLADMLNAQVENNHLLKVDITEYAHEQKLVNQTIEIIRAVLWTSVFLVLCEGAISLGLTYIRRKYPVPSESEVT